MYLISRGRNCCHQIDALFRTIKVALKAEVGEAAGRRGECPRGRPDFTPPGRLLVRKASRRLFFRACDVSEARNGVSTPAVATINPVRRSLVKALEKNQDSQDGNPRPAWLFNMCRLDQAIQASQMISPFLARYLEGISVRRPNSRRHGSYHPARTDPRWHRAADCACERDHLRPSSAGLRARARQGGSASGTSIHKLQNRGVWRTLTGEGHGSIASRRWRFTPSP